MKKVKETVCCDMCGCKIGEREYISSDDYSRTYSVGTLMTSASAYTVLPMRAKEDPSKDPEKWVCSMRELMSYGFDYCDECKKLVEDGLWHMLRLLSLRKKGSE